MQGIPSRLLPNWRNVGRLPDKPLQGKKFMVMRQILMNLGNKEQAERQADSTEKEKSIN